jgi:hypothetical protein
MFDPDGSKRELASRRREERMRYEVLAMACRAARRDPDDAIDWKPVTERIGVWRDELSRVLDFLDGAGLLRYRGDGPKVSITRRGIEFLYGEARSTKAVPDGA